MKLQYKSAYLSISALNLLTPICLVAENYDKPNILFIMADDHSTNAISAYGGMLSKVLQTPNIDRIGREGAILQNCFVTNSISTPSRACILTGQYSHMNGVYTLFDTLNPESPTFVKDLQNNGYTTALFGKWHLKSEPAGFDFYSVLPGQGVYENPVYVKKGKWTEKSGNNNGEGVEYEGHETDIVTNQTLDYLQGVDKNKPFMVMCHYKAPHRGWIPADRFKNMFNNIDVPEPKNLFETYENKGNYSKVLTLKLEDLKPTDYKVEMPKDLDDVQKRKWLYQLYIKDYLRCVAGVDENVGRLLKYLDDNNLAKNTIVVYTSDQGFFLGEHGWFDKRLMFDEAIKMPFLIRYPQKIKRGTVRKEIITNIDFAPTILDYAGISSPQYIQGLSFKSILENKTPKDWQKAMYYRYWAHLGGGHDVSAHYGIRTQRYKLIFFYGLNLGNMQGNKNKVIEPNWELYDLKKDPLEMNNIYFDSKNLELIKTLKKKLLDLKKKYRDEDEIYPELIQLYENCK